MKRFLTLQRLVSIIAVVCSSQIFPILEFSTSRVSFIFSIIPSQPTLAHPVTRKPSYYLTAPLVSRHCLCQGTVQHKDMSKQLCMI